MGVGALCWAWWGSPLGVVVGEREGGGGWRGVLGGEGAGGRGVGGAVHTINKIILHYCIFVCSRSRKLSAVTETATEV